MTTANKKPGAFRQPGKVQRPIKDTATPRQRLANERIVWQAAIAKVIPPELNHEKALPDLWHFLQAAKAEARIRPKAIGGRLDFKHKGRAYVARFTAPGRISLEERRTGRVLVESLPFEMES